MKRSIRHRAPLSLGLAGLLALPVLAAGAQDARADQVRVRVHGRVDIGDPPERVRRVRKVRVRYRGPRVRVRFGGGLYVRFATPPPPPPPPCTYECGTVSYYEPRPAPPAPVQAATVVASPPEPEPLRWGIGAFAGSLDPEGQEAGTDLGVLGRFRLSRSFELEAEVAKTELADDTRVDKRIGAALLYDFSPGSKLSPFVLGGLGFGQTELDGGTLTARQGYAELGGGLTLRLSRRVHITGDLRAGERKHDSDVALKASEPNAVVAEDESYLRGRIGALLYF